MRRREFLRATTLAGTGALLGLRPESGAAAPPPETSTLRLTLSRSLCVAPQFVAEEFLRLRRRSSPRAPTGGSCAS